VKNPVLELAFTGGIDEAQRAELVDPRAAFITLENVRQNKRGGATKRYGFSALTLSRLDATNRSTGYKLFAYEGVPCVIDGSTLDVYATAPTCNISRGRVPVAAVSFSDLPSIGIAGGVEDVEYCNGYVAASWRATASVGNEYIYAAIIEEATGSVVKAPEQLGTYGVPLLGSYGTYVILLINRTGVGIVGWYIDTASAATLTTGWVSMGTLAADIFATPIMSIASVSGGVCIAYTNNAAATNNLTVRRITIAGSVDSTTVNTSTWNPSAVDCAVDSAGTLWVAWSEVADVKACGLSAASLSSVVATTSSALITVSSSVNNIAIAPNASVAGKGRLAVRDATTPPRTYTRGFQTTAGATASDGASNTVMNSAICGRAFSDASNGSVRYYMPVWGSESTQKNCILVDWTSDAASFAPVANIAPGLVSYSTYGKCKTVAGSSSTKRLFGVAVTRSSAADASQLVRYDFASSQRWQPREHGKSLFLSGGLLAEFDGARVAESGFLIRPKKPTTSVAGTGITGSFLYVAIYEEVDANGNWHVSGVSDPSAAATPANQTVTVSTSPLTISGRLSQSSSTQSNSVRVAFYSRPLRSRTRTRRPTRPSGRTRSSTRPICQA
jgi:hypothetical protein